MYPTYQRALPDTTLYERLQGNYMPIQGAANPYAQFESNSLSQDALDYRADPFAYVKKKFGSLDETLKEEDKADVGLKSLFGSTSGGGDRGGDGRNYYAEREAQLRAANLPEDEVQSILRAEQETNNARLAAGLKLFANAFVPGVGLFNADKYGQALPDYLQGNLRTMIGDSGGYRSPFTPKAAGIAAPVVGGQSNYNTYSVDPSGMEAARVAAEQSYGVTPTFDSSTSYSDGYSAQGDGSGGYSAPTRSDPYGGVI